ncbi:MAG: sensor histidine kinase [Microbacterium sp.]
MTDAPLVRAPLTRRDLSHDAMIAGGLFIASIISTTLSVLAGTYFGADNTVGWSILASAVGTLPLAVRRRNPSVVAFVVCGSYIVAGTLQIAELYVSQVEMFIAFYTIGAWVLDRRLANRARAVIIIAMGIWLLVATFLGATNTDDRPTFTGTTLTPYLAYMVLQWLINIAYFGGAFYMGNRAYVAAREHAALVQRTSELEEERELSAAQAVALDRVRIARELHDVVAHHVSAMGVQAGAARTVIDQTPDKAKNALSIIEQSSRSAIAELHHLLDTLRSQEADPDFAANAPSTLGLDRLDALAETMTASGIPTRVVTVGEPRPIPHVAEVNLYRIAQEALTNARRHGGPDVTAEVRVRYGENVELEITNTGRVALDARPGLGQLGMRERAIASGGSLEVKALPRGGYLVRATVPLAENALTGVES